MDHINNEHFNDAENILFEHVLSMMHCACDRRFDSVEDMEDSLLTGCSNVLTLVADREKYSFERFYRVRRELYHILQCCPDHNDLSIKMESKPEEEAANIWLEYNMNCLRNGDTPDEMDDHGKHMVRGCTTILTWNLLYGKYDLAMFNEVRNHLVKRIFSFADVETNGLDHQDISERLPISELDSSVETPSAEDGYMSLEEWCDNIEEVTFDSDNTPQGPAKEGGNGIEDLPV